MPAKKESKPTNGTRKIWAMEPSFLINYLETVSNVSAEDIKAATDMFSVLASPEILSIDGDRAELEISGPLSMNGPSFIDRLFGYDGTGYSQILNALDVIAENPEVRSLVLKINSPGGEANGVDLVYNAILKLKKNIHVVAENHGLVASAAYWIATAADEILATGPSVETGSIGVIISALDSSKMLEKFGVKRYRIVSKNAPNKNPDISTSEGRDILQERVDALERVFVARVAEGRKKTIKDVEDNFGQGGVFIAQDPDQDKKDAIRVGMIDGVIDGAGLPQEKSGAIEVSDPMTAQDKTTGATPDNAEQTGDNISEDTTKTKGNEDKNNNLNGGFIAMNELEKFLSENPGAEALYNAAMTERYNAGAADAKQAADDKTKKVSPYLIGETDYPAAIRTLAGKVLTGESEMAALEGAVTVFDMQKEQDNSDAAAEESQEQNETPAGSGEGDQINAEGIIESDAEMTAALDRINADA